MVSIHSVVLSLAVLTVTAVQAQTTTTNQVGSGFLNEPRTDSLASVIPKAKPAPALTPEMRGDILMARKMFREAVDAYAEGDLDSPVIANKIGIAYHQMLLMDLAKRYYERAIRLKPTYAEAINNLGTVYYAKKNFRRATSQYQKALKLTPAAASIYSNLGTAYFARKKYEQASVAYEKALDLDPEVFERHSSQGVLLQERSVEERAKFHYYLAKTYAKSGHTERALLYIRKCLEEGFREKDKFHSDPEFALMQELPEFKELLALEPRVL
jgi:tetratricopeptide (TPR) repeat protein